MFSNTSTSIRKKPDYEALDPMFGWFPDDNIKHKCVRVRLYEYYRSYAL